MRGEKTAASTPGTDTPGSPPRARGKGLGQAIFKRADGITPACAGKSRRGQKNSSAGRDHPRVRGEKARGPPMGTACLGSPPRARGKVAEKVRLKRNTRITPACAGKRQLIPWCVSDIGDHPRVRGEKQAPTSAASRRTGSPPRARGKGNVSANNLISTWITPACAGKSCPVHRRRHCPRDHPRVRGEKSYVDNGSTVFSGSPPRARGKARAFRLIAERGRITPACAGKSQTPAPPAQRPRDHPRVRGEKRHTDVFAVIIQGSPPRARGKERPFSVDALAGGITPACAGKSTARSTPRAGRRDHPRVRGEKTSTLPEAGATPGSPPRARGKVAVGAVPQAALGITPACAGKSLSGADLSAADGDHPRVRGEKLQGRRRCSDEKGSPPRARGKDAP